MERPGMIYLTPTAVRIWHWLNALGIVTLCITGVQIRFPEYVMLFGTYKTSILLHDTAGIVVSISYLLWLFYYLVIAGTLKKLYIPTMKDVKEGILRQSLFYGYYFFQGGPNPHHSTPESKFNPMQKAGYMMIMLGLMPVIIVSGLMLLNVGPMRTWIMAVGGLKILIGIHYLVACMFFAFLFVHVYLATMGHSPIAHFKPMWHGWEEVEEHEHGHAAPPPPRT